MESISDFDLRDPVRFGLLAGGASLGLSAIGMVELFGERDLVYGVITLGVVMVFAAPVVLAYVASARAPAGNWGRALMYAGISGLLSALPLVGLILLATNFDIRQFLINVSPALIEILTFGEGPAEGILLLVAGIVTTSLLAGAFHLLPDAWQRPLLWALVGTLTVGLFSEILTNRLRDFFGSGFVRLIFQSDALKPVTAAILFALIMGTFILWRRQGGSVRGRLDALSPSQQRRLRFGSIGGGILLLFLLPALLGTYLSEVINNVGLYVLMGLGLNIVVGFAGLLDLGYVAFFAIGAYTMGVLTSQGELGLGFTFWTALPICVAVACLAGIILGLPVLRMRGDYLAIVTLGFGEIIRILALSDLLKPYIGGAQGVLQIPKPSVAGIPLVQPEQLYFVVLAGVLLAWFVSWRLSESRLGRQWMAVREDEDVAQAMGIELVKTKLLAFAIGASFSGLSGAIFASKLTSIFPHSFSLLVSINVLCLIIVGGMGSLPGVAVGALILVGLPELLREFAEYRLLMYGALLIVMMLARPEGFWPSAVRQRELRAADELYEASDVEKRTEAVTIEAGD
jgi:branched-chain amino acid transport system permease protein